MQLAQWGLMFKKPVLMEPDGPVQEAVIQAIDDRFITSVECQDKGLHCSKEQLVGTGTLGILL